jgi:hypothetical protein
MHKEKQKPKKQPFKAVATIPDVCSFCNKTGNTQEICHQFRSRQKDAQEATKNQKPRTNMAKTGESEKLIGIEGDKALVTLVTYEASKLRKTASYKGKGDNDVSQERSE